MQAQDDKRFVDSYFEEGFRIVAVQVIADNGSALTPEALNYLGSLSEQTQSIAVSAKDYDGAGRCCERGSTKRRISDVSGSHLTLWHLSAEQIVTYESRCLRFGPNCYQQSLLEVFNGPEEYDTTEEILSKVNEANLETTEGTDGTSRGASRSWAMLSGPGATLFLRRKNPHHTHTLPAGFPITPGDVIGGITRDSSGSIEDAKAVRFVKLFKVTAVSMAAGSCHGPVASSHVQCLPHNGTHVFVAV